MSLMTRALSLLLIVLLTSGSMTLPALRHSHSPHDEHAAGITPSEHHSHHSHSVGHHHDHHLDHAQDVNVEHLPASFEHLHVIWFGFPLTLPVQSDDSSNLPVENGEWVSLVGEMQPISGGVEAQLLAISWINGAAMVAPFEVPQQPDRHPPSLSPLCDLARHARTGVLRI